MKILLTNDDGMDAPGLAALESAAVRMPGVEVFIVAPATEQSMCGHRITTHSPLRVENRGERRWAVHGTPADCVRIGLYALDLQPDWVLSGVNAGGNMGQDIFISGTCAAAREAVYHGLQAAAFSHYLIRDLAVDWVRTAKWTSQVFQSLLGLGPLVDAFWCVNFPHLPAEKQDLPEWRDCQPARSPLRVSYEQREPGHYLYSASYAERPQDAGSDVAACFQGHLAVSRIDL